MREAYVTGGLPPLERSADEIYRATYKRLADRNRRYYARYPEDVERVRDLVALLGVGATFASRTARRSRRVGSSRSARSSA